MAGKAERALIAGTDNVYDFKKYRALKTMSQIVGHEPDFFAFDESLDDVEGHKEFKAHKKCLKGWFDDNVYSRNAEGKLCLGCVGTDTFGHQMECPQFEPKYLEHHFRMTEATKRMKARQEFINGNSTDS